MYDQLSNYQKDQLLHFFTYYMPMAMRQRLMNELPLAYNALYEKEYLLVLRTSDASPIIIEESADA